MKRPADRVLMVSPRGWQRSFPLVIWLSRE
jgi:hypothetical protein